EAAGQIWYALTPELDMHPHVLAVDEGFLKCLVCFDSSGAAIAGSNSGTRWYRKNVAYGDGWDASPLEAMEALEFAQPPPPSGLTGRGYEVVGIDCDAGADELPAASPPEWFGLISTDGAGDKQKLTSLKVDSYVRMSDYALAKWGGSLLVAVAVDPALPGADFELDARLLPLAGSPQGIRHLAFSEGVIQLAESAWPGWPMMGPRTVKWHIKFLSQQDQHPRARRAKWVHEANLEPWGEGAQDHDLAMRMFEIGIAFDQANIA
ncbi:unnamed protein product, partial [Prorocentrum cordatum]